ncbi:MAG: type III-A CRISPR-associated RAMP protein Csm3 [Fidelibacterota bacterium]
MQLQLRKKIFIHTTITAQTGLHIGGSGMSMAIGGADSPVLRDPLTNIPYIPGSSLKGKMRSLLERMDGKFGEKGGPCECGDCPVCVVFGVSANRAKSPARLQVRDAFMRPESIQKLENSRNTDMPYSEVKTEVVIDRVTARANPRQIERVPAGTSFDAELALNIYAGDNEEEILKLVEKGLRLVADDYLGGSGTRGYGKVEFGELKVTYKTETEYAGDNQALPY